MKNIIITGGELFNKGAQAMTFVTVCELKKRFPNHRIILLSEMDKRRSKEEKDIYDFDFMGWYPIKFARAQKNPLLKLLCKIRNSKEYQKCCDIYSNTDMMVDISGYALSPKFSENALSVYADNLEYAYSFSIPFYILPQSFGPFEFVGNKKNIEERISKYLRYAKLVCAREKEGYIAIKKRYSLENVLLLNDIVLNNMELDLNLLFNNYMTKKLPKIKNKSVAIIPNGNSVELSVNNDLYKLYRDIISLLGEYGYTTYILYHSTEDKSICEKIYLENKSDNLVFLNEDFDCLDYSKLVNNFDFVIASRFHSIVHAFKENIPCIALGWAEKYRVLLSKFGQEKYNFDVREQLDKEKLLLSVKDMIENIQNEKIFIAKNLKEIQDKNIFDIVFNGVNL